MRKYFWITFVFAISPTVGMGAETGAPPTDQCVAEQSAVASIAQKYKSAFDGYQKEGEDLKNSDAAATFKFDVTWADTEIKFETPSVKMKNQRIVFGVPQMTMKRQDIIFGTPSVRMKRIKTGQYPEFFCHDTWISLPFGGKTKGVPACTTRWHDIFTDIPEPFMQEQRIKMDIPEFKWADTQIIMGIPEFFMQSQRIVMGLPQFKLNSVVINSGPLQDKSNDLQRRVSDTRSAQMKETGSTIHVLFDCYRNQIHRGRDAVSAQFDASLGQLDAVAQSLRTQGADPTKVPSSDGTTTDLVTKRNEVATRRQEALATFDDALAQLDASEKEAVEKLK